MPRFFVEKNKIDVNNGLILLDGENAMHLMGVLRARTGDEVVICDGDGIDYICKITEGDKKNAVLEITETKPNETEPDIKLTLYQGIAKGEKNDFVIQKAVEIGYCRIVPVATEFTVVKLDGKEEKKLERWNKIARSAAEQSQRGIIPRVEAVMNFKEAVNNANEDLLIIPYEKENSLSIKQAISGFKGKSIGVFIGPEGGFSFDEIKLADENNIKSVTLGKRILRSETAGLVAGAVCLYELEE